MLCLRHRLVASNASQTLTIDAIRTLMPRDPTPAAALLVQLKEQSQQAVADHQRGTLISITSPTSPM